MTRPRLFIGSSSEELTLAEAAAGLLEKEFDVIILRPCRCSPQPLPLLCVVTNNRSVVHQQLHLKTKQSLNQHNELRDPNCPNQLHKTGQKNIDSLPELHSTSIFHAQDYDECNSAFE
jgi:hypothetical protein